jgi:hypothetical protein
MPTRTNPTGSWQIRPGKQDSPPGVFAQVLPIPLGLVVVGADPVALAIAMQASQAGSEVEMVRPHGPISPPPHQIATTTVAQLLAAAPGANRCRIPTRSLFIWHPVLRPVPAPRLPATV